MKELITTDNNCGFIVDDPEKIEDLLHISNCSLDSLRDLSGHDLWLFPPKGDRYDDKIDNDPIFTISGNTLTTSNIMGFVGKLNLRFNQDLQNLGRKTGSCNICFRKSSQLMCLILSMQQGLIIAWT